MEELDLRELFNMFWGKKIEIVIITLIFVIIGGVYSFMFTTPKYKSSTTLVLATLNDTTIGKTTTAASGDAITQTELTLNSNLVSTYSELVKSKSVLREVISNLNLNDINEDQLKKNVSVTAVKDTELIEISVSSTNSTYPSKIANEIAKVFTAKVAEIYNINNVHVVDKAEVSKTPYNINHIKDIIIFAFIGVVISAAKILLMNMLDNTVKTEQDIEHATGMMVLAQIPKINENNKKGKGGKR